MKNCNSVCLNGMPLKADMEKMLGIPVVLANDANCLPWRKRFMVLYTMNAPKRELYLG